MTGKYQDEVAAALAVAADDSISPLERAEMLMEIATGLQQRPETADQLRQAVRLHEEALQLATQDPQPLLQARIQARLGTALMAVPDDGPGCVERAAACFENSRAAIRSGGSAEEQAELEMNLGLALQTLAGFGKARLTDAVHAYHRSLRTFDPEKFPREYAILQNNLATAYLNMPVSGQRRNIREALAVQAFEQALRVVNMIDYPAEYAMLQNNLGNALQFASTTHSVENCLRALDAYDEALKVRRADNMPEMYANTISNKATCLLNIPDDLSNPDRGNASNKRTAVTLYQQAMSIFRDCGEDEKAGMLQALCDDLMQEIAGAGMFPGNTVVEAV